MSESKPTISIIVPIFNVEKHLRRCLDSILEQQYIDWELICVNDASPDTSSLILSEYASRDSRIQIITHKNNKGLSEARNSGIKVARGEWIIFIDSDDCIHPQLLECTLSLAKQHAAKLVAFDYEKKPYNYKLPDYHQAIDATNCKIVDDPFYYRTQGGRWVIHGSVWSKLYKKEILEGLYFKPFLFEDYPYTLRVMLRHPRTVILKEALYYYSCNPDSIMQRNLQAKHLEDYCLGLLDVWQACENASAQEKEHVLRNLFPDIIKQMFNRIRRSPKSEQPELWKAFAAVLRKLKSIGCLGFRGHKISRWLRYMLIMHTY